MTQASKAGALGQLEGWIWEGGGRRVRERGDPCMPMADLC